MKLKFWLPALIVVSVFQSDGFALSLSVVGALSQGTTRWDDGAGDGTKGKLGYGAGLLLDGHLSRHVALETGGIYLVNRFDITTAGVTTPTVLDSIDVPLDLRFRLDGPLSLSAGGYYDHFTRSGTASDAGVEGGLRLSSRYWFIDGRFMQGLKDQGGFKYSNVLGLLGFRL